MNFTMHPFVCVCVWFHARLSMYRFMKINGMSIENVTEYFCPFYWIYEVTLVNKTDFRYTILHYIIGILYCVFTTPSQVFFHHHLSTPWLPEPSSTFPHTLFPLAITIMLPVCILFFPCLILSPFSPSPQSLPLWQLSACFLYPWVSLHFVSLFCSWDFTYKGSHMVLVFLWLAYFT